MDFLMLLLPASVITLAGKLKNKDANNTGADDAFADILMGLAPVLPDLIKGSAGDNAADKAMLATYKASQAYLQSRGKLPA